MSSSSTVALGTLDGEVIYHINRSDLSIAPGERMDVKITLDMIRYTTFFVHYFVNTPANIYVHWRPTIASAYALEKTIPVAATPIAGSGGLGGVLAGTTKSRFLSVSIENTDPVVTLTHVSVSVYATRS